MHPVDISALRAKLDEERSRLPWRAAHFDIDNVGHCSIEYTHGAHTYGIVYACRNSDGRLFPDFPNHDQAELAVAAVNALPGLLETVERYARALREIRGDYPFSPTARGMETIAKAALNGVVARLDDIECL